MKLIKLNIGSFFKVCEWDPKLNTYNLIVNQNVRAFGTISEDILKKIIDINIDVLTRLLGFNTGFNINRTTQIMDLFVLASKYSQEKEIKVFGYDINEILEQNIPQLTKFLDTHFEQSIDDIIQYDPKTVEKYLEYGRQLKKYYDDKMYNNIVELLFKINDITMEFSLHLLLTMLNISYLLFMDLTCPSIDDYVDFPEVNKEVQYELNVEVIATRQAYGALQQFIINEDRKYLYQQQILTHLKDKYNISKHVLNSDDPNEIEAYIFNHICKQSKQLKSVYPHLAIKREINTSIEKIYNVWNGLDPNKKSELALSFGFKKGDSFDMLPYILTIGSPHILRLKEFSRYAIQTLLSQLDKTEIQHFSDFIKEYDDIFDYILFPDRESTITVNDELNSKFNRHADKYTNINAFENGKYNGKYLLNKIIGKSQHIKKILNKLMKQQ